MPHDAAPRPRERGSETAMITGMCESKGREANRQIWIVMQYRGRGRIETHQTKLDMHTHVLHTLIVAYHMVLESHISAIISHQDPRKMHERGADLWHLIPSFHDVCILSSLPGGRYR